MDLELDDDVIGITALKAIHARGVERHQLGLRIADADAQTGHQVWYDVMAGGEKAGDMTNGIWSPRLNCTIGFALISIDSKPGDEVVVMREGSEVAAVLCELPFP